MLGSNIAGNTKKLRIHFGNSAPFKLKHNSISWVLFWISNVNGSISRYFCNMATLSISRDACPRFENWKRSWPMRIRSGRVREPPSAGRTVNDRAFANVVIDGHVPQLLCNIDKGAKNAAWRGPALGSIVGGGGAGGDGAPVKGEACGKPLPQTRTIQFCAGIESARSLISLASSSLSLPWPSLI